MHPDNIEVDRPRFVEISYTNYKGEHRRYQIIPHSIYFGHTEFHPIEQWMLKATDVNRNVTRDFAMKDIHGWRLV